MQSQLADPLISCKLGLTDEGGAVVIVGVQGHAEALELTFTDLHYFAGVVRLLGEMGGRCLRVATEGWDAVAEECDGEPDITDEDLRRFFEE